MFGNFGMGMNFGGMKLTSESIDKKLKDPKTEVEDLLREEDLLQEFRSQNEKLIDYFDRNKIKRLVDYIIKEPEVDEQEKGYKFPFLCSQIFGLELDKMIEPFFVTNKQLEEENKKNEKKEEKNESNEGQPKDKEPSGENANNEKIEVPPEQEEKKNDMNENNIKKDEKEEVGKMKEDETKEGSKKEGEEKSTNEVKAKEGEKKEEADKAEKKEGVDIANKDVIKEGKKEGEEKKINDGEKKEEEKKEEVDKTNKNETKDEIKKEEEKKVNECEGKEENKNGEKNEKEGENGEENSQKEKSKENQMELLDHLFSFFPEKEEEGKRLNYVLCGYFSSIISNLLSINPTELLKYVYTVRGDILYKMVNHCYRKSISDTLSRILHFENYFQSEDSLDKDTRNNMEEKRKEILSEIFQKIDINKDNEDLNSIYFLITGLFDQAIEEEKLILESIVNDRRNMKALLTRQLFGLDLAKNDESVENKRKNFMVIIDIVVFLLTTAKKLKLELPTYASEKITHTELSKEILDNLGGLIKNIFNKKIEDQKNILQSFNEYQLTPLGEYKIKVIDLLSHIIPYFKNISKKFDEILIETEFFQNAFKYLYEYEWNNIYQESLLTLLKSIINDADNHELIQDHLFKKLNIIEEIKTHTNSEDKYKFNNKNNISNPISHGYYSFFISLSYKINTALGGTPVPLKNNTITRQGSFSFMAKPPEDAMSSLYGNFGEDENNENEAKKEEEKFNYETMKKYINDDWRILFGNISEVIQQYENRDWPEEDKKDKDSSFGGLPGQNEGDILPENNGEGDKENNIMERDDNNVNDNGNNGGKTEEGEQGNNNNGENSSPKNVSTDDKDSGNNDNEKKEEIKQKENELKNEAKGDENKIEGAIQSKETEKSAKEEEKAGNSNNDGKKEEDENKKDGEKKEENKDGNKKEETKK